MIDLTWAWKVKGSHAAWAYLLGASHALRGMVYSDAKQMSVDILADTVTREAVRVWLKASTRHLPTQQESFEYLLFAYKEAKCSDVKGGSWDTRLHLWPDNNLIYVVLEQSGINLAASFEKCIDGMPYGLPGPTMASTGARRRVWEKLLSKNLFHYELTICDVPIFEEWVNNEVANQVPE